MVPLTRMRSPLTLFCIASLLVLGKGESWAEPEDEMATKTTVPAGQVQGASETTEANENWVPITFKSIDAVAGSALDFSSFLDAPAGKHGAVIVQGGHFAFRDTPDQPTRFYGTVMGHGMPYMDKAQAEQYAAFLAASGYNLVRFHNYTFMEGVLKEQGSPEFNAGRLDQWEYLLSCLKKRGIYFTFPLNSDGFFKAGAISDIPEYAGKPFRFEAGGLLPVSADARANLQQFARNLLTHVNPYTGLALKDEPALISVELVNEDPLFMKLRHFPDLVPIYRRKCAEFLREKQGTEPSAEQVEAYLPRFVLERHQAFFAEMKSFLTGLGVNKPVTDITVQTNMAYAIPRADFDYTDTHAYWALYKKLPDAGAGDDAAYRMSAENPNTLGWSGMFPSAMAARLFGHPMMCGEFNSNYPSPYWLFTGPMASAMAATQGWSALVRCGMKPFPRDAFAPSPLRRIEIGTHPLILLSERIGALNFTQGGLAPFREKLPLVVTPEFLLTQLNLKGGPDFPPEYSRLWSRYQLGTVLFDGQQDISSYSCLVAPKDMPIPEALKDKQWLRVGPDLAARADSFLGKPSNRSVDVDQQEGTAQILGPLSETFLLTEKVNRATGPCLSVSGNSVVSVCFAGSLDRQPLVKSNRVLALYLTDLRNTGTVIEREKDGKIIVRRSGELPLLVHQGKADFAFTMPGRALPEVWALKFDGTRSMRLPVRSTKDGFAFTAQAVSDAETFGAFEVFWPN